MKKLSALMALLLCVTIGGVYATWTYAGTNDIADAFAEAKVTIADAELSGANGTYKIESNLVLTVDQKASNDHTAELKFAANDGQDIYLTVTFTPAENAPVDIKENGVPSELYFGVTTDMKYKMDAEGNYNENGTEKDIFKFANASDGVFSKNIEWTEQDGAFTYTLDEAALRNQIQLNDTFVLDIKAEHDAFREAMNGNIVARVTDGIIT